MKNIKKTPFWKITRTDSKVVYIIGTMHVKDDRAFTYRGLVEQKILECDAFAAEYALDESQNLNNEHLLFKNGESIYDHLSSKKSEKFRKKVAKYYQMDLDSIQHFKPLVISNILSESIFHSNNIQSLDYYFWSFAQENGKFMTGVEQFESQMVVMEKIPLNYQLKSLSDMLNSSKKYKKYLQKIMKQYQDGEIQKIYKSSKKSLGKIKKLLLYNRNVVMADSIEKLSTEQSIVCAIGVGHLAGKQGVLKLLKDKGFALEPIKLK